MSEPGTEQTRVGHVIEDGDEIDVYAARGSGRKAMGEVPIGKRGWLGNPYPELKHGREGCIEKFREDFEERLRSDDEFREAIRDLAGQRLGCFCQTLDEDGPACHAEVIAEHADRLASIRADGSGEQLTVEEIESRPHPNRMDNEAIWEEKDELVGVHEEIGGGHLNDLINERWGKMLTVLEQRIDPDYPECPHCESSGSIGYAEDGVVVCKYCYQTLPEDVRQQYADEYARVWGNAPGDGGESDAE